MADGEPRDGLLGLCRVLDLTTDGAMLCGKILGDFGADVIQIEPPGGNPTRSVGPFYHDDPNSDKSLTWFYLGLNKRGVTLDLDQPEGQEIFRQLVATADFVVESFRPGYLAGLGLGYEDLRRIKLDIIMTAITPFGQTGPYIDYQVTDIVGVALTGQMWLFGETDRAPVRISAPQFFMQGGLQAAMGSMVAQYHHDVSGEGQYVDQSCQQAMILTLANAPQTWDFNRFNVRGGGPGTLIPRPAPLGPIYARSIYSCRDGYVVCWLGGGQAGRVASSKALVAWANEAGHMLEFKDHNWMEANSEIAQDEVDRRFNLLQAFLKTKTKDECLERAVRDAILMIPVNDVADVTHSPQLAYRDFFENIHHSELGDRITYPGFPIRMTEMQPVIQRRAPLLGEHNAEVYGRELGISEDRLRSLKKGGVI